MPRICHGQKLRHVLCPPSKILNKFLGRSWKCDADHVIKLFNRQCPTIDRIISFEQKLEHVIMGEVEVL